MKRTFDNSGIFILLETIPGLGILDLRSQKISSQSTSDQAVKKKLRHEKLPRPGLSRFKTLVGFFIIKHILKGPPTDSLTLSDFGAAGCSCRKSCSIWTWLCFKVKISVSFRSPISRWIWSLFPRSPKLHFHPKDKISRKMITFNFTRFHKIICFMIRWGLQRRIRPR